MRMLSSVSSFLLASLLPAQIVLPNPIAWPLGCPVPSTIANDGAVPLPFTPCTPMVTDSSGQIVTYGLCMQVELLLQPGETFTTWWSQQDQNGAPVPPGTYYVNGRPYAVGAVELALQPHGAPHPGSSRHVELCATNGGNVPYALAAAFGGSVGIPLGCGVHLPLDFDWLLVESLTNPAVFADFVGVLDADGRTSAPAIVLPPLPILNGITFDLAFVTLDPGAPCGFGRASGAVQVTIQ
jgi:hypothetical protein